MDINTAAELENYQIEKRSDRISKAEALADMKIVKDHLEMVIKQRSQYRDFFSEISQAIAESKQFGSFVEGAVINNDYIWSNKSLVRLATEAAYYQCANQLDGFYKNYTELEERLYED